MKGRQKTVLVYPFNAVGHINATITIADRLKKDFACRIIYLVVGPTINIIKDHGHELVIVEDAEPLLIDENDPEIICKLQRNGFSIDYLRKNGTKINGMRKLSGFAKWPVTSALLQDAFIGDPIIGIQQVADKMVKSQISREYLANYEAVDNAVEAIKPDLILVDHLMPPVWTFKNNQKIPWVRLRSANPLMIMKSNLSGQEKPASFMGLKLYNKIERARLRSEEPEKWKQLLREWKRTEELVNGYFKTATSGIRELFEANNCSWENGSFETNSPYLNIYLMPDALDYAHENDILKRPPRWIKCDSLVREPIGEQDLVEIKRWCEKLEKAMEGKIEMVYFSLGSIASSNVNLMQKYIKMLWDDEKRLFVIAKGCNGDNLELNPTNMIGANYLPQTFLLQRAKLAILHGGNNGLTESIYYGVPMIVLPMFGDQLDNAQRVEDVGLGRRLDLYHCTKGQLRQVIEQLSGDVSLALRMREISEKMRLHDNLAMISNLIQKLIDKRQLEDSDYEIQ